MMEHDTQPIGFRIEWAGKTLSVSAAQVYNSRSEDIGTVTVFRDFTREAEVEKTRELKDDDVESFAINQPVPITTGRHR